MMSLAGGRNGVCLPRRCLRACIIAAISAPAVPEIEPRTGKSAGRTWPARPGGNEEVVPFERFVISCVRAAGQELKFAIAGAQPTPWIQTFWIPAMSGAMSPAETIICAVKDSSLPSPAR